jgi:hypothetical protein
MRVLLSFLCYLYVYLQNRTYVYMNFFDHKDLGNHLLQLCPKVVKHSVYNLIVIAVDGVGLLRSKTLLSRVTRAELKKEVKLVRVT